jgi:hypothetical protein
MLAGPWSARASTAAGQALPIESGLAHQPGRTSPVWLMVGLLRVLAEVYQNLRRFLLGTLLMEIEVDGLDRAKLAGRVWRRRHHLHNRCAGYSRDRGCPAQRVALGRSDLAGLNPRPGLMTFSY